METNPLSSSLPVLTRAGLRLLACVAPDSLSSGSTNALKALQPLSWTCSRLILIGHVGQELWPSFQRERLSFSDESPLDEYSLHHGRLFLQAMSAEVQSLALYPSEHFFPLTPLLQDVQWSRDSLLGLGIHGKWGLWQAVRAVFLVEADWPEHWPSVQESPCLKCVETPCVSGCLGAAMTKAGLEVESCLEFRLQENSPCALQCSARASCPVGAEHRYSEEQEAFHYGHSLEMLRRWKRGEL